MKWFLHLCLGSLWLLWLGIPLQAQPFGLSLAQTRLSAEEQRLYDLIMAYRAEHSLPPIPLSRSLSYVAQLHVRDLHHNRPDQGPCNLHSWSDQGNWTPTCYTSDHAESENMWNKPRELTAYPGNGFEVSYGMLSYTDVAAAVDALGSWQTSSGHRNVILNQGIWQDMSWQAIGIGLYNGYVNVWFGQEADPAGPPISSPLPAGPQERAEIDPVPNRPQALDWATIRLSREEQHLYELIMEYRDTQSLPSIPLSRNLSFVAQLHVRDLHHHQPDRAPCDSYSWSDQGPWTPGCFTGSAEAGSIIWEKPRELTSYPGDGFEICFSRGHNRPATAAEAWASWQGHTESLEMFLGLGSWQDMNWRAIGIGIYQEYVSVWFGLDPDPDRLPLRSQRR